MSTRSPSSPHGPVKSPPPTKALLDLQKQGLELSTSWSSSSFLLAEHASARSTPSDLDKPLPLEPFDNKRRSSSVYSTDTTITNIIQLYGGYKELERLSDLSPMPLLHQPQAYRDTVAPLLIKRLSLSRSPSPRPPTPPRPRPKASVSSISLISTAHSVPAGQKTAPSFMEFSRNLQDRRNELVSPISSSSDHHRQAAYDKLFPPSPQVSSVELSIAVTQTPPLPDAMSGTISDVAESELLPSPPALRTTSPPSSIYDSPRQYSALHPRSQTGFSSSSRQAYRERHWSENWLEDDFRVESPVLDSSRRMSRKSFRSRKSSADKEKERILSFAASKYPGMNPRISAGTRSQRRSKRVSLQQGVNGLLRTLSISSPRDGPRGKHQDDEPRQRQLAIQPTPYQMYGDQIRSTKKNNRSQDDRPSHKRNKSSDFVLAYQSGQSQFVNVLEGAKQKLTGKTSRRRRRKLKQSIIVVGPSRPGSIINHNEHSVTPGDDGGWI